MVVTDNEICVVITVKSIYKIYFRFIPSVTSMDSFKTYMFTQDHPSSLHLNPPHETSIRAWEQFFFHGKTWLVGSNLPTVDHRPWKNILQLPRRALDPELAASTAINRDTNTIQFNSEGTTDEINCLIHFLKSIINI